MCVGDGGPGTSAPSLGNQAGKKVQEEALLVHTAACHARGGTSCSFPSTEAPKQIPKGIAELWFLSS